MSEYILRSARFLAKDAMERHLHPGDTVIDATMGNGHDTLWLCNLVGKNGCVDAFDIQAAAVANTRALLEENGVADQAHLHLTGHEHMAEVVDHSVNAVMFNLGWLPGGDKSIRTRWQTTQLAIRQALGLLKQSGLCIICVYPGHEEGTEQLQQIRLMLSRLRPQEFNVLQQCFINAGPGAPVCFQIQRQ